MLGFLRDQWTTTCLRARYRRMMQEQLLALAEDSDARVVSDAPEEGWQQVGGGRGLQESERTSSRDQARRLVRENPYAANILRLLECYVTGPGVQLCHHSLTPRDASDHQLVAFADQLWRTFLEQNRGHYSYSEHARRTWRDGECFIRLFPTTTGAAEVRFVDPERIGDLANPHLQGIITAAHDVERPIKYLKSDVTDTQRVESIPAEEMLHTRRGADSNEKRGVSLFLPLLKALECYEKWLETEMQARKLQSSIVLWRKIQGSPSLADSVANRAAQGSIGESRRERFTPGTILTTNHGTDIQFLQPNTNFGDAVPLGRMLLLSLAAGAGLPEFMLTADASNANFASTMVAEGPAVKFFQSEQQTFADEFTALWRRVMQVAVNQGQLPENFFERIAVRWSFPQLVNRDRSRERLADVRLIESGVLSRAEVARRDGVDPAVMKSECDRESATACEAGD